MKSLYEWSVCYVHLQCVNFVKRTRDSITHWTAGAAEDTVEIFSQTMCHTIKWNLESLKPNCQSNNNWGSIGRVKYLKSLKRRICRYASKFWTRQFTNFPDKHILVPSSLRLHQFFKLLMIWLYEIQEHHNDMASQWKIIRTTYETELTKEEGSIIEFEESCFQVIKRRTYKRLTEQLHNMILQKVKYPFRP